MCYQFHANVQLELRDHGADMVLLTLHNCCTILSSDHLQNLSRIAVRDTLSTFHLREVVLMRYVGKGSWCCTGFAVGFGANAWSSLDL